MRTLQNQVVRDAISRATARSAPGFSVKGLGSLVYGTEVLNSMESRLSSSTLGEVLAVGRGNLRRARTYKRDNIMILDSSYTVIVQ